MPNYRRANVKGSMFFFTVVLADRSSNVLVEQMDRLRKVYRTIRGRRPFETIAICILPDHIHALWSLPKDDSDFSTRWNLNQGRVLAWHGGAATFEKQDVQAGEGDLAASVLGARNSR